MKRNIFISLLSDAKDVATEISADLAVGQKVKVVEWKNAQGIKTLTVTPAS